MACRIRYEVFRVDTKGERYRSVVFTTKAAARKFQRAHQARGLENVKIRPIQICDHTGKITGRVGKDFL